MQKDQADIHKSLTRFEVDEKTALDNLYSSQLCSLRSLTSAFLAIKADTNNEESQLKNQVSLLVSEQTKLNQRVSLLASRVTSTEKDVCDKLLLHG